MSERAVVPSSAVFVDLRRRKTAVQKKYSFPTGCTHTFRAQQGRLALDGGLLTFNCIILRWHYDNGEEKCRVVRSG